MAISNINEKLTIKKEDTILAKLIKFVSDYPLSAAS